MPKFVFTECQTETHIGEKEAPSVEILAWSAVRAWRNDVDTFSSDHGFSGVTRVTEEDSGRVVGWMNSETGKFVKR